MRPDKSNSPVAHKCPGRQNLPQTYHFLFTFGPRDACVQCTWFEAQRPQEKHALSRSGCCLGRAEDRLSRWAVVVAHGARLGERSRPGRRMQPFPLPETVLTFCTGGTRVRW